MAGQLDIDDDMQRMVLRKGEATAKGVTPSRGCCSLPKRVTPARSGVSLSSSLRPTAARRSPSTFSSCAWSTKPSATTCCCASTRCVGARPTCTSLVPDGDRRVRAVIDQWCLKRPEAH